MQPSSTSASGSRLLAGEKSLYQELEREIADWKHAEDALVCVGGHSTNVTVVGNFCGKGDLIVYDALAHNSIEQGCRLSRAVSKPFPHNDPEALENILKVHRSHFAKVLIVIEGLTMYLNAKDVQQIFAVISNRFPKATVFVETMNPMIVKRFKEKSIEGSHAKFTWGVKNGSALAALLPDFRFIEEHSLCEGMAAFAPIYKLLDRLPAVRNISNKIIVLEKE